MFDANLRGAPSGEPIMARFHGSSSKFGDKTNILTGDYECQINKDRSITVYEPRFRNEKAKKTIIVTESNTGNRWVTYEGHVE